MSLKGDTNKKWTSTDEYRKQWEEIFKKPKPEPESEGE